MLLPTVMLEVTSVVVPLQEELVVTSHVASEHLPTLALPSPSANDYVRCGEAGHKARECPTDPQGPNKCFNCGDEGHV